MTRRKSKKLKLIRDEQIHKLLVRGWINSASEIPPGAIPADPDALRYGWHADVPRFYEDRPFTCRDCGKLDVWKAEDQQWYYEVVRADISHTAVRCSDCRRSERERKAEARRRSGHAPPTKAE